MILLLLSVQTWKNFYTYIDGSKTSIELSKNLELEQKDISEKTDLADKHKLCTNTKYATQRNDLKKAITLHKNKHRDVSIDVLTPPPEIR